MASVQPSRVPTKLIKGFAESILDHLSVGRYRCDNMDSVHGPQCRESPHGNEARSETRRAPSVRQPWSVAGSKRAQMAEPAETRIEEKRGRLSSKLHDYGLIA